MKEPNQLKRRKVKLPRYSKLNKKLIEEFDRFVEAAPAARLSRNLRDMFLLYLSYEKDGLPVQFEEFVMDFYFLLKMLDAVGKEVPEKAL